MRVTLSFVQTGGPEYLTDHCNREGETLLGVDIADGDTVKDLAESLRDAFNRADDSIPPEVTSEQFDSALGAMLQETRGRVATCEAYAWPAIDEWPDKFRLSYKCPRCGETWNDESASETDDDCPKCGNRHISPRDVADLPEYEPMQAFFRLAWGADQPAPVWSVQAGRTLAHKGRPFWRLESLEHDGSRPAPTASDALAYLICELLEGEPDQSAPTAVQRRYMAAPSHPAGGLAASLRLGAPDKAPAASAAPDTRETESAVADAARALLAAMESPRSRKAAEAWDRLRSLVL